MVSKYQATERSATIIDFTAYRTNKRAAAGSSRNQVCSTAPNSAIVPLYVFWLFLAWTPLGLMGLPVTENQRS